MTTENNELNFEQEINFEPIPEPEKKGLKPWMIIGLVAVLVIALAVFALPKLLNSLKTMGMSPAEYYASLEAENIEQLFASYNKSQGFAEKGYASNGSMYLELTEEGKSLVESFTGVVIDNYVTGGIKLQIDTQTSVREDLMGTTASLLFNGVNLLDTSFVVDYENQALYGSIPLLAEGSFSVPMENASTEATTVTFDATVEIIKLMAKYGDFVTENMPEMTRSATTLTVLDTSLNCDLYEMKLSQEEAVNFLVTLCEEIKADEEAIRTAFKDIAPELAEEIIYGAELLSEQANEVLTEDLTEELLVYRAWIKNGEIIGRELTLHDGENGDAVIALYSFVSGGKLATQIVVEEYGYELLSFEGVAKSADGVVTNGEFALYVEGLEAVIFDIEKLSIDGADTEAELTVTMGDALLNQLAEYATLLEDVALDISIESNTEKFESEVAIIYANDPLIVIGASGEATEYQAPVIPENTVDITTWAMGVDAQTAYLEIVGKLGDAGVNPLITLILGQLDISQLLSGSVL